VAPQVPGPEHWVLIEAALSHLLVFVSLALCGGLALLLANAVLPSLASESGRPAPAAGFRLIWLPLAVAALSLALLALGRAIVLAGEVLRYLYPRLLI
jgi:hypothetical protein